MIERKQDTIRCWLAGTSRQYDLDILFSILHTNLITDKFKIEFAQIFRNKYKYLIDLIPDAEQENTSMDVNINNGWLSGFIDANSSIYFDGLKPRITINLSNDYEILLKINTLFPNSNLCSNKKTLIFSGDKGVKPLLLYLEKYPLKYQKAVYDWFLDCMKLRDLKYQYKPETKKILRNNILSRPIQPCLRTN